MMKILIFAGMVLLMNVSLAADEPEVNFNESLVEAAAKISESVSSIYSLDCVFEIQFGEGEEPKTWRFARQGQMWHRSEISHEDHRGEERTAGVCYDGEYVYTMVVRKFDDGSEEWRHIEVQDGDPEPPTHVFPDAMIGSRLSNMGGSIVQAWESVPPQLETTPDGTYALVSKSVPSKLNDTLGMNFDVKYTINSKKGFVPSDILITESGKNPEDWFQHWIIEECKEFIDNATGKQRWFPVVGRLLQPGNSPAIVLSVKSVEINKELPMSLFRPETAPEGTVLLNATSEGEKGQLAIVGSDRQLDKVVTQVVADTKFSITDHNTWSPWILIGNGVILIAAVFWWLVNRKKSV